MELGTKAPAGRKEEKKKEEGRKEGKENPQRPRQALEQSKTLTLQHLPDLQK